MKIYHIYHSCFIIETKSSFLIFDFYKAKAQNNDFCFKNLINDIFKSEKNFFVFASHSHSDHYNGEVLSWRNKKSNIYYIFSNDIKVYSDISNICFVKPNQELIIENIKVNTFGSTDLGVSFLVNLDNINIFHAGDLNWWKWKDDTRFEAENMECSFKKIINDIKNFNTTITAAFFPVDYRLEENYLCGGEYVIEALHPQIFIPMHFQDSYKTADSFIKSQINKNSNTKIPKICCPNQLLIDDSLM